MPVVGSRPVGEAASSPEPRRGTRRLRGGFVAVAGGASLAAGFEPAGLWAMGLLGPLLLVVALRGRTVRGGAVVGATFGLVLHGLLLAWLAESMGVGAWLAVVAVQTAWFAVLGVADRLTAHLPCPAGWFAVVWVAVETARSSWPFGGLPWGRLGFLVIDTPWQGLLPYLGVAAVGWLIAFAAALLGRGLAPDTADRRTALTGGAAVLVLGAAPILWPWDPGSAASMRVAVVQGGVPGDGRQFVEHHREVTDNHVRATRGLAAQVAGGEQPRPQLVVWPENSTAVDPTSDTSTRRAIQSAVDDVRAPLLVGGMVDGPTPGTVLNQGLVWDESGPTSSRYTKRHPVPFGEYIPFRSYLGGLSPRLVEVPLDMLPGATNRPLDVAGTPIADVICFDVAYDDVLPRPIRDGARLVVVQTSNASFIGTAQLEQQFAITRVRALEAGRAVAVASTNGVSAMIDPSGRVLERAPLRDTAVLVADLPLVDAVSPAMRWGSAPGTAALFLALLGSTWAAARLRRVRVGGG